MTDGDSRRHRGAGRVVLATFLVVVVAALAAFAGGCGDAGGDAYLGAWLESGQQSSALRITNATDRVLVDYLDLTRSADEQTVFSTEATVEGDNLRLSYESAGGEVVKGGTLQLSGDGATLVWTTGKGARREFRKVTVLPTSAP